MEDETITKLADSLGCSYNLASDLADLAGGNLKLVQEASDNSEGVHAMKVYIINKRLNSIETKLASE